MRSITPLWLPCIALLLVLIPACSPPSAYQEPPPSRVTVATPIVRTVPIWHEENGDTEAVEQAIVRSRVRGILQEIMFEPDAQVTEGKPLFQIEQKEFVNAVQAATAAVSSAKAAKVSDHSL